MIWTMGNILIFIVIFIVSLVLLAKYLNKFSLENYNYEPVVVSNILWMIVPYMFLIAGVISENNTSLNLGYLLSLISILIIIYNIHKRTSLFVAISSGIILFFSSVILVAVVSSLFSSNDNEN